jgi:hypothetical protein
MTSSLAYFATFRVHWRDRFTCSVRHAVTGELLASFLDGMWRGLSRISDDTAHRAMAWRPE